MTIADLIAALQAIAQRGGTLPVYLDSGGPIVSQIELDEREDEDGPWLALVAGAGFIHA